jgi:non-ribosomal peptide synthetase component F
MGLTLNPLEVDNHTAKVSLQLNLTDTEREIIGSLDYDPNLFTSGRMNGMLERFQLLLERVVIQPDTELRVLEEMLNLSNRQRSITNEEILQRANSQSLKKSRRKSIYIPGS